MAGELAITVLVDKANKKITITDSAGNQREVEGVWLVGGGFESRAFYLFGWGASADVGWALAESFRWSKLSDYEEAPFYRRVWAHCIEWIATFLGFNNTTRYGSGEKIGVNELLERWRIEDEGKKRDH